MQFKVYREYASKRLRTVAVALLDAKGKVLDVGYVAGLKVPFLGLRLKLKKRAMLKLQAKLEAASGKV